MPTQTTNYGLFKPLVNDATDEDLWGGYLNDNMDTLDSVIASIIPSGLIMAFGSPTSPAGWLKCNGTAISRATYANLFAAIGTAWGAGDGSTTFNVPDFRGQFLRGFDDGSGIDAGRTFASMQADQNASHTHTATVADPGHSHIIPRDKNNSFGTALVGAYPQGISDAFPLNPGTNAATTGITVTNASSGGGEARPKNSAVIFIIKT